MAGVEFVSFMSLYLETCWDDEVFAPATGFVATAPSGKPYLITNYHVASGRNQLTDQSIRSDGGIPNNLKVWLPTKDKDGVPVHGEWSQKTLQLLDNWQPLWHEHPVWGRRVDLVAIELLDLEGVGYNAFGFEPFVNIPRTLPNGRVEIETVNFNFPIKLRVTRPLFVLGFPFGMGHGPNEARMGIWSSGTIASEPEFDFDGLPLFLIDSRTRPGQSGSPVLFHFTGGALETADGQTGFTGNQYTKLVGIYSGRINSESDLGKVWKASAVQELLATL